MIRTGSVRGNEYRATLNAKRLLKGHEYAQATYGTFQQGSRGLVVYTATVWRDENGHLVHNPDSEFGDDLQALRNGSVEYID